METQAQVKKAQSAGSAMPNFTIQARAAGMTPGPQSAAEKAMRKDLAACYRLVAHFGWDDLIATHISARVPAEPDAFLLNPFGWTFDEITPECLIKVNLAGEIISETPYAVNRAGFVIHSAIHEVRHDASCVIHLHTRDGIAVSCLAEGLMPLNQRSIPAVEDLAYHDYEGPATDADERRRLQNDLGAKNALILRNHGTLALGTSVPAAFYRMRRLEQSCSLQVQILGMGRQLHLPSDESLANTRAQLHPNQSDVTAETVAWPALMRKLERAGKLPAWD